MVEQALDKRQTVDRYHPRPPLKTMIWEDISTAPTDTFVLIRYAAKKLRHWDPVRKTIIQPVYVITQARLITGSWIDTHGRLISMRDTKNPSCLVTHWMPLPEEP